MKLFDVTQIRAWDQYSITEEGITSVDLMERAAKACVAFIEKEYNPTIPVNIFCGMGNNGGDGLAIARLLKQQHPLRDISVWVLDESKTGSPDFQHNLQALDGLLTVQHIRNELDFPSEKIHGIIIDALLGSGFQGKLRILASALIRDLNTRHAIKISVDIPGGLPADGHITDDDIFRADITLTFQQAKRFFFSPESEKYTGRVEILPIQLSSHFYDATPCNWFLQTEADIAGLIKPVPDFAHKGIRGHAALWAGSRGMMGAAILATRACLRSGAGKLSCYVPEAGCAIIQSTCPEAICISTESATGNALIDFPTHYQSFGIGPGISMNPLVSDNLHMVLQKTLPPLLLDADALNILAANPAWQNLIPANTILTPHPAEFDRLWGSSVSEADRIVQGLKIACTHGWYILLKGHYSKMLMPDGTVWVNSTGNHGMAKGGSGDVLSGLITGLLAQGYEASSALRLGVYWHGLAGDLAAEKRSKQSMTAGDIIEHLGMAWQTMESFTKPVR